SQVQDSSDLGSRRKSSTILALAGGLSQWILGCGRRRRVTQKLGIQAIYVIEQALFRIVSPHKVAPPSAELVTQFLVLNQARERLGHAFRVLAFRGNPPFANRVSGVIVCGSSAAQQIDYASDFGGGDGPRVRHRFDQT